MGWRFKKRLTYILILFFIIFVLISPKLYKIIFYPSCFNNRQDPGEEGVDCGGPCIPCEVKELKDLVVGRTEILIYDDDSMDLIGRVYNPNPNYGLKEFSYKFIIYGPNNETFEKEGKSFILPLENKYIIETNLKIPNFQIKNYELKINYEKTSWQKLEIEIPKITLLSYEISEDKFKGDIVNESTIDLPEVILNFIFRDINGDIVGTSKITIFNLKGLEKREVSFTNLPKFVGEVHEVILYPEINLFKEL